MALRTDLGRVATAAEQELAEWATPRGLDVLAGVVYDPETGEGYETTSLVVEKLHNDKVYAYFLDVNPQQPPFTRALAEKMIRAGLERTIEEDVS